jgi:hypothetical protein
MKGNLFDAVASVVGTITDGTDGWVPGSAMSGA